MKTRNILLFTGMIAVSIYTASLQVQAHSDPAPIEYVKNEGQWPQQVIYRADASGAVAFLENDGITWSRYADGVAELIHDMPDLPAEERAEIQVRGHAWRMEFVNISSSTELLANDPSPHYRNYFIGNDPLAWAGHVPSFSEITYQGAWPGIDIRFHGNRGNMKYDLELAPNAEPALIAFQYHGLNSIHLNEDGNLILRTSVGDIMEVAPIAFHADGNKERVECSFVLDGNIVRFQLGAFDPSRPVTIDPELIAATYSGATGPDNYGHCATYDNAGNIYTAARSFGMGYPTTMGAFQTDFAGGNVDISISKLNADGSALIWASYFGGSDTEYPHSLIVNSQSELCILGTTTSTDLPVTTNAFQQTHGGMHDIHISVFASDGSQLIGSTYIGGELMDGYNGMYANYGESFRGEIIVDANDNIHVASCSSSLEFPITSGSFQAELAGDQDAVVFGMDATASQLLYSTYLGGTADDAAMGITTTNEGVVLCGYTMSSDMPTSNGAYQESFQGGAMDGFVINLDATATTMIAGTYFGGPGQERSYFLDIDLMGNIWIFGQADSSFQIQPAGTWGEAGGKNFIAKFDQGLTAAPLTTVFGQGRWGVGLTPVAFEVDNCDKIHLSGYNAMDSLPLTDDALYTSGSFYVAEFLPEMADLEFATYFGGSHVDGGTSRFNDEGVLYQAVCSGGNSMQTTPWAYAPINATMWDIGVFKLEPDLCPTPTIDHLDEATGPLQIQPSLLSPGDPLRIELPVTGTIRIYDAIGRSLFESTSPGTIHFIETSSFVPGTYLVRGLDHRTKHIGIGRIVVVD